MVIFAIVVWAFIIVSLLAVLLNLYFVIGSLFRKELAEVYDIDGWPIFLSHLLGSFVPLLNVFILLCYSEEIKSHFDVEIYKPDSWK